MIRYYSNMIRYYSNDDNPDMVIRFTEPASFHVLLKGDKEWFELPLDNSFMREVFRGQGNNCLTKISIDEAKRIAERLISDDLHADNKESIDALFPSP